MPPKKQIRWAPEPCPFCKETFAGKIGLKQHLRQYVNALRIPADGIHDALEINEILYPSSKKPVKQYQCPGCPAQISDQAKFVQHVVNNEHLGEKWTEEFNQGIEGKCESGRTWALPFNEESVLVIERKGAFKFLALPYEVRHMVYEFALVFDSIKVGALPLTTNKIVEANEQGIWLQHNPKHNLLSLLAVNRQVYEEAKRVFYCYNSFIFNSPNALLIFLFGIGPTNSQLLRSIQSTSPELSGRNLKDAIRSCLVDDDEVNIWSDVKLHENFFKHIEHLGPTYMYPARRTLGIQLFRPGVDRPESHSVRRRYTVSYTHH